MKCSCGKKAVVEIKHPNGSKIYMCGDCGSSSKPTEAAIGFDFDEISKECSMKDPTFRYEACDLIKHRNTDARYPFRNDCNETNCILMHLLRVIGPMLIK